MSNKALAIASLIPGERFYLKDEDTAIPAMSDESHVSLIASVGEHNLTTDEQNMTGGNNGQGQGNQGEWDGTWNVVVSDLIIESASVNRPSQNQIDSAVSTIDGQIAQAQAKRQTVYDSLSSPVLALVGQSIALLSAADAQKVMAFNAYMGGNAVSTDALGNVASVQPVELAPIVYPTKLTLDDPWLIGIDNSAAFNAFIA